MLDKKLRTKIFINRQPSLWRHSVPFVEVKPIEDDSNGSITLNPLFLEPLNCDFDGDTLALYVLHDNKALKQADEFAFLQNDVYYDHSDVFLSIVRHEALYSAYLLTKDYNNIDTTEIIKIDRLSELIENIEFYNKINTCIEFDNNYYSYGICLFNKWCGFDKIIINTVVNKKNNNYVSDCVYQFHNKDGKKFYDNLNNLEKNLFFYISINDIHPPTIDIEEMSSIVDSKTQELINKIPNNINVGYLINDALVERSLNDFSKKENNTLYNLFKSGSRFSEKQLSRSCINIGFCADSNNMIMPKSINTNLLRGLTEDEFFAGASGTRKGISDKGRSTPDSGYLERSLVMGLASIEIAEEDCGTTSYLETKILNEKHKQTLIGKWYKLNESDKNWSLFDNNSSKDLTIGQTVYIRSPIYCITPHQKICQKCWGEKKFNTKYLGILAGQILAERFTQLTMRSFHESGSAQINIDKNLKIFVRDHLTDIDYISEKGQIFLVFDTEDIPEEFKKYSSWIETKRNQVYFVDSLEQQQNNDPIEALRNVKLILRVGKNNIKKPNEYYDLLIKQVLTVGAPYTSFVELLLTNMFLTDKKTSMLWRYDQSKPIKIKLGDKTLANKTSPLLGLLYQQNQTTINDIEILDQYIENDRLTIYEKMFLEKF